MSPVNATSEGAETDSARMKKDYFTPVSMWIAIIISIVLYFLSLVIWMIRLVTSPEAKDALASSGPETFFDSGMMVLAGACVCILLGLLIQISRKAKWPEALEVVSFPNARAWLRVLPMCALFVVVVSALAYLFIGLQLRLVRNFKPDVMLERLERSMPESAGAPPLAELKRAHPFPAANDFEEQVMSVLKYPFEHGFGSRRFLLYLGVLLLFGVINELIFRGIGYGGYRQTGSNLRAVIITSLVNGIFFFPFGIVLALILGWVRVRGGSLYCSIVTSMAGIGVAVFVVYEAYVKHVL